MEILDRDEGRDDRSGRPRAFGKDGPSTRTSKAAARDGKQGQKRTAGGGADHSGREGKSGRRRRSQSSAASIGME